MGGLEAYCFQIKNQLQEEKLKDKFTEDDKKVIEELSKDTLQWLESNTDATVEEYEAKQKEVEGKFQPIIMRIYQAAGVPWPCASHSEHMISRSHCGPAGGCEASLPQVQPHPP